VQIGERGPASAERQAIDEASQARPELADATEPKRKRDKPLRPPEERRFAWAPVAGASGYHVEFFRGSVRVLARETSSPQLTVPPWLGEGKRKRTFVRGEYRWYVWTMTSGRRAATAIVQATFIVS
jgi:hypothetical protein